MLTLILTHITRPVGSNCHSIRSRRCTKQYCIGFEQQWILLL